MSRRDDYDNFIGTYSLLLFFHMFSFRSVCSAIMDLKSLVLYIVQLMTSKLRCEKNVMRYYLNINTREILAEIFEGVVLPLES